MQGHPVELILPVFPFPVRHGVAEGADIHILSQHERSSDEFKRLVCKLFRKVNIIDSPSGQTVMVGCHIIIETTADCHSRASLYGKFAFLHLCREIFASLHRTGNYEFHIGRFSSESSRDNS